MKILEQIKNIFRKQPVKIIDDYTSINVPKLQIEDNIFTCHYCGHRFEVNPAKDIFPTSVRLLYKDQYVTGKGVTCPNCLNNCIFG